MRKLLLLASFCAVFGLSTAEARPGSHTVRGYTNSNGTYVAPHVSANPSTYSTPKSAPSYAYAATPNHQVSGYVKKDGTYVAPYRATDPDGTKDNNYSTRDNVNPYNGKIGTKPRDRE